MANKCPSPKDLLLQDTISYKAKILPSHHRMLWDGIFLSFLFCQKQNDKPGYVVEWSSI